MSDPTELCLDGFSASQREVILFQLKQRPVDQFVTIPEEEWRKYHGCGSKFIEKLKLRGWVKPVVKVGLSTRAQHILDCQNIEPTPESVRHALTNKLIGLSFAKPRNYGVITHKELLRFAGLNENTEEK
jgi:hypothetical protein